MQCYLQGRLRNVNTQSHHAMIFHFVPVDKLPNSLTMSLADGLVALD